MGIRCLFGHDWKVVSEAVFLSERLDNTPFNFHCGEVEYRMKCSRCSAKKIEHKPGMWQPVTLKTLNKR